MATDHEIALEIQRINEVWNSPQARNGRFGNMLKSVQVKRLRGMTADLEFSWPVTAIAGTNGSGKTTLLQLCSTAYVRGQGGRHFKIGEWVRNALAGESPAFDEGSEVSFSFWNDHPTVTIPYQRDRTRWGYPRHNNPQRFVSFYGITTFAPRVERRDRVHVFKSRLEIRQSSHFSAEQMASISTILGVNYPEGIMHTVGAARGNWSDKLPQVRRGNYVYAEPHMGAGEQKIINLVRSLEALSNRSLILLEEPEITLHPDAQRGLAWYLMSLARRKGHQIIVATHSAELFETLPSEARVLLTRREGAVDVIPRPPSIAAARELARVAYANRDLILVEDTVAQAFLREILRRYDVQLFENCCIVPVGNTDDVYRLVRSFRAHEVRAVGVRDPDIGADPPNALFSLPGHLAPESLLLAIPNIVSAGRFMNGIVDALTRALARGHGLQGSERDKAVFSAVAHEMRVSRELLTDRLTLAWLGDHEEEARNLAQQIRQAFDRD
ncbi:ATP-dependent nuclease [Achromobacter animicus]